MRTNERDRGGNLNDHTRIGGYLEFPTLLSILEGALGLLHKSLGRVQVSPVRLHQALDQAQRRAGSHHLVWEHRQPALEDHVLAAPEGFIRMLLNEPSCPGRIPRRRGMVDRFVDQPVLLTPGGGPSVEVRDVCGLDPVQPGTEEIAEQVMVSVPVALLIQRDHEQVGAFQSLQHFLAIRPPGHLVTQRAGESLEDRALEQEHPHWLRLAVEHLVAQVVEDVALGPREGLQEDFGVPAFAHGESGQL